MATLQYTTKEGNTVTVGMCTTLDDIDFAVQEATKAGADIVRDMDTGDIYYPCRHCKHAGAIIRHGGTLTESCELCGKDQ